MSSDRIAPPSSSQGKKPEAEETQEDIRKDGKFLFCNTVTGSETGKEDDDIQTYTLKRHLKTQNLVMLTDS
jgi:hypothetical protein